MQVPVIKKTDRGRLPNLIIIGAMKSATTSLHYYLSLHPQISMSREKELNFFARELNWRKGLEWYRSNFRGSGVIFGESSPSYTNYPYFSGVPERMHAVVPTAKLIYIVRNPMERVISNYVQRHANHLENRTFEEALRDLEDNPYVVRSRYFFQLERYLSFYPRDNILVISTEALLKHRERTLNKVFEFLGVEPAFHSLRFSKILHRSRHKRRKNWLGLLIESVLGSEHRGLLQRLPPELRYRADKLIYWPLSKKLERPKLSESLKQKLLEHFSDDVRRLAAYTGEDFAEWR